MHSNIKVTDLNLRQWDFLTTEVPVSGRTFLPGLPRVCVEFELTPDLTSLHIEMDVAEFAGLVCVLEGIKNETIAVAQAALTPDALPDPPGSWTTAYDGKGNVVGGHEFDDMPGMNHCARMNGDGVRCGLPIENPVHRLKDTPFDDLDRLATPEFFADSGLPDAQIRNTAEMDWDESR